MLVATREPQPIQVLMQEWTVKEEWDGLVPSLVRTGSHSVRFTGRDMVEISRFMEFASAALSGLAR